MDNQNKIRRCAVIGAGQMGHHHARVYQEIAQLVAVGDVDLGRAKKLTKLYGGKAYADYSEMIREERPDAISVVVPTFLHYAIVKDTLNANIPTLLEKPISETVAQARALLKLAEKQKVPFMIGHVERFNPVVIALKKLLEKQTLGNIIAVVANRVGIAPPATLHSDVSRDLAIHDVDVILSLLHQTPMQAHIAKHAVSPEQVADSTSILMTFKHAAATVHANWISPFKIRTLHITGDMGYAELDYLAQTLVVHDRHNQKRVISIEKSEPLTNELEFFLQQKKWNTHLRTQVSDAIKALQILLQ